MDLSQQELPLTAYFTRAKETGSRAVTHKKGKPTEDSPSVGRPSKRRKSNVQSSARSPPSGPADKSKAGRKTLQLPTPATSTRKRLRSGRLGSPPKAPLVLVDASSPVGRSVTLPNEDALVPQKSGTTVSKLPESSHQHANTCPATPAVRQGRASAGSEFCPGLHRSGVETGIATPRSLPRRISELAHGIDDHTSSALSNCTLLSKSPDPDVSQALPPSRYPDHSTAGSPSFPSGSDSAGPFYHRKKSSAVMQLSGTIARTFVQHSVRSRTVDSPTSDGCATPLLPVASSQSQYLLHPDATPKRKRCSQYPERVMSSQTQEELELTLSTPCKSGVRFDSLTGVSLKTNHQSRTHGSTPVGSPINSSAKKSLDKPRHGRSTSYHSSSYNAKTPRRSSRCDSIENIPPIHIEDSLTESESELDIPQLRMKDKLSALDSPSRVAKQVLHHSSAARNTSSPIRRGSTEGDLPGPDDDSATEAESDTEILHCVAAIGRSRPSDYRAKVLRGDTPPPLVISPLVSPTRPRIATVLPITDSTRSAVAEDVGQSIPGSHTPPHSAMQLPAIPSESLPSAVRDFFCMFPGDESYPADFPESLRI